MEMNAAQMNKNSVLEKTRPKVLASPIFAIPTTSVEMINGAIIILIKRRKISVKIEISEA
jgi:hypothetical protein